MKFILSAALCLCLQFAFAQRLTINHLETILQTSFSAADQLLIKSKFKLVDKEIGKGYHNYYYTSYEKPDSANPVLRSISIMDVYQDRDTSRLILYRTYYAKDNEDLKSQLLASGYQVVKRSGNEFIYQKENTTITNKVTEKKAPGNKPVTAYEFELGR